MIQGYVSLAEKITVEIEERKSRFIAIAAPAVSAQEAEALIAQAREDYPDATHHCYAYRAGLSGTVVRTSDDGEPQGTAGRPILDVIERNGLENACIVVVRYFGGIKLGAGGLVRAYRAAAAAAVERAGVTHYVLHTLFRGKAPYDAWSRVAALMEQMGVQAIEAEYGESVEFRGAIWNEEFAKLQHALSEQSSGEVQVEAIDASFYPAPGRRR